MGKKSKSSKNKSKLGNTNTKNNKSNILQKKDEIKKVEITQKEEPDEKSNNSFKSEKKKVAISYKKLKENHEKKLENKDINKIPLEDLKIIASNFDLDPLINFRVLLLLKEKDIEEYNRYITKYKYTLNYEDSKKLKCFNINENEIKNECLKNFGIKITNIKSLSKLKLFNFLFFLIELKYDNDTINEEFKNIIKEIKDTMKLYENDVDLVFKIPNKFGNYELQYYTYLGLFILYFNKHINPKQDENDNLIETNDINENFEPNENDIYFDWDKNSTGELIEVDMSNFEKKKNDLKNFIKKYLEIENNMEVEKNDSKKGNNKIYIKKTKNKVDMFKDLSEILNLKNFIGKFVQRLRIYKSELYYLFRQDEDEKIIKQIEFIYFGLLFRGGQENSIYDSYPNCLYNDPKKKNENLNANLKTNTNEEIRKSINQEELVFANIDEEFPYIKDNPFVNRSKYYKYPKNLEKNIFKENKNIEKYFKKFLKEVFQSPLLEEIFYLTPEFNEFKYPLKDDEILNEMIDNTIFIPFDNSNLDGYTQKLFSKVYISNNMFNRKYKKNNLSDIIIKISFSLNTMIHEQLKHYLKGLIFYNSFRFKIYKRLDSDLSGYYQESFFIDNIRKIYQRDNKIVTFNPLVDGGYRAEIYLYGSILHRLSVTEALKMFKKNSWNISVLEHLKLFNDKNKKEKDNIEHYSLDFIKNNKDLNDFIKEVMILFSNFFDIEEVKIDYSRTGSEKSRDNLDINDDDGISIDYGTSLRRDIIKKPDTETDKRYLYLFDLIEEY